MLRPTTFSYKFNGNDYDYEVSAEDCIKKMAMHYDYLLNGYDKSKEIAQIIAQDVYCDYAGSNDEFQDNVGCLFEEQAEAEYNEETEKERKEYSLYYPEIYRG